MTKDRVIVISGPSGSGKTTILKNILPHFPQLRFSVSATTRPKREHEIHGEDYYFISIDEFRKKIEAGEFVEYEEVYPDIMYGTLRSEITRLNMEEYCPVLDIDVAGAVSIKNIYVQNAFLLFIDPGSLQTLRERLTGRNTEDEDSIKMRLSKAEKEMKLAVRFDRIVMNIDINKAVEECKTLISNFLKK